MPINSKQQDKIEHIYEPDHILKTGISTWKEMVNELLGARSLIWSLIIRDIRSKFKQSFLGVFWAFIAPLIMMIVFVWTKNKNILPIPDTSMPYPIFVFSGQMFWLLFSQGTNKATMSLVSVGSMLTKVNFPREVLIISSLGETLFDFIIRTPLFLALCFYFNFSLHINSLFIPILLLPLLIFTIGIGFYSSIFNAVFRDIGNIMLIALQLGMFITPIIYPPPKTWPLAFYINILNPSSGIIITIRDFMTSGNFSSPSMYLYSVLVSILLLLSGWRFFHLVENKIAERA